MTTTKTEREEFIENLRAELKPGDTVFTVLRHKAPSGMTRWIDLYVIRNNEPHWLSYWVAKAGFGSFDEKRESIRVGGCGMDMGFALVYNLSGVLYPDGFALPMIIVDGGASMTCIPTDKEDAAKLHAKGFRGRGRNGDTSGWDNDGGYALEQRWL